MADEYDEVEESFLRLHNQCVESCKFYASLADQYPADAESFRRHSEHNRRQAILLATTFAPQYANRLAPLPSPPAANTDPPAAEEPRIPTPPPLVTPPPLAIPPPATPPSTALPFVPPTTTPSTKIVPTIVATVLVDIEVQPTSANMVTTVKNICANIQAIAGTNIAGEPILFGLALALSSFLPSTSSHPPLLVTSTLLKPEPPPPKPGPNNVDSVSNHLDLEDKVLLREVGNDTPRADYDIGLGLGATKHG